MNVLENVIYLTIDSSSDNYVGGAIFNEKRRIIGKLRYVRGIKSSIQVIIKDNLLIKMIMRTINDFVLVEIKDNGGSLIGKTKISEKFQSIVTIKKNKKLPLYRTKIISHGTIRVIRPENNQILAVMIPDVINDNKNLTRLEFHQNSSKELLLAIALIILLCVIN